MNIFSKLHNIFTRGIHNKTVVNGTLFSMFSFFGQGMSFLLLLLLANYILPAEYGKLSLFNTVVTFVGYIIGFSSRGYCSVTFFKKKSEEFKKDFTAVFILGVFSLFLIGLPVLLFGEWLGNKLDLSEQLLWFIILIAFFSFTFQLQQDFLRNKEKVVGYGILNCGQAVLNFVLSLILVIDLNQNWLGRVNAQLICTLLFGSISLMYFLRSDLFRVTTEKKRYKEILSWSIPMIPHSASGWLKQGLDRYIINFFYSSYQVGIFSFALNITNVINVIGIAFNSTNSVTQYQILSDKELSNQQKKEKLHRQTRFISIVYFCASIAVVVLSSVIVKFFLPKYIESIPYFWILSCSGFGNCLYYLYCNYLFFYNSTKQLMLITFGTAVLHLLLSIVLTRASLFCTSIVYCCSMTLMVYLVRREAQKLICQNLP